VTGIATAVASTGFAHFAERERAASLELTFRTPQLAWSTPQASSGPSETSWVTSRFDRFKRLRLTPEPTLLSLIGRYQRPWENHTPEWRTFFDGRYGFESAPPLTLAWSLPETPEPLALPVVVTRPCPRWKAPRPLTILRYAGESERLPLFDCDGAIAPEVIERLSVLARAPETPRPAIPLPDAVPTDHPGEWLPGLRLLEPRLVWLLGKIQGAFPGKRVVIMSGYRPDAHTSNHKRGKALDLYVDGVPNEQLFAVCRMLNDVGCGYYPHNYFVHLDVRAFGAGKVAWVDVSEPGAPSRYVNGWPGVLEPGAAWIKP
jgi:hypothetical protein